MFNYKEIIESLYITPQCTEYTQLVYLRNSEGNDHYFNQNLIVGERKKNFKQ